MSGLLVVWSRRQGDAGPAAPR